MDRGEYNKALVVSDSILNALANNELNEFYAKTLLNKQIIYLQVSNFQKSIEFGNLAYLNFFKQKNILGQSKVTSNFVQAYYLGGNKKIALNYGDTTLMLLLQQPYKEGLSSFCNNMGIISEESTDTVKALKYYYFGLKNITNEEKQAEALFSIRNNLVDIYLSKNIIDTVEQLLKCNRALINKYRKTIDITCIYNFKESEFKLFYNQKNYIKALNILSEQSDLLNKIDDASKNKFYFKNLYLTYLGLNNKDSALKYLLKYSESVKQENDNTNEFEINKLSFEVELKKEQEINSQKISYEKKIKNYTLLLSIGVVLAIVCFLFIVYKNLRKQKVLNKIIKEQKYAVDEKQKEIIASINYAKRIQKALLPNEKYISKHINKSNH